MLVALMAVFIVAGSAAAVRHVTKVRWPRAAPLESTSREVTAEDMAEDKERRCGAQPAEPPTAWQQRGGHDPGLS